MKISLWRWVSVITVKVLTIVSCSDLRREFLAFIALYLNTPSLKCFWLILFCWIKILHFLFVFLVFMENPFKNTDGSRACMSSKRLILIPSSGPGLILIANLPNASSQPFFPCCLHLCGNMPCLFTISVSPRRHFLDLHDLQETVGPVEPVSWSASWMEQCFGDFMGKLVFTVIIQNVL